MCCLKCLKTNKDKHGGQDRMVGLTKTSMWKDNRTGINTTAENFLLFSRLLFFKKYVSSRILPEIAFSTVIGTITSYSTTKVDVQISKPMLRRTIIWGITVFKDLLWQQVCRTWNRESRSRPSIHWRRFIWFNGLNSLTNRMQRNHLLLNFFRLLKIVLVTKLNVFSFFLLLFPWITRQAMYHYAGWDTTTNFERL